MDKRFSLLLFLCLAITSLHMHAYVEEQCAPPRAFDKIYVTPTEIFCSSEGTFYISPTGEHIKVNALSRDCNGPFVILITRQCSACGRYYTNNKDCLDGYDCPLWEPAKDQFITMPNIHP